MKPVIRQRSIPLITMVLLMGCASMGGPGALLVSEQDEVRLGAAFDAQLRTDPAAKKEFPVFVANTPEKQAFQNYVIGLAQSVLAAVPEQERPGYAFHFTLIDAPVENAFAVPGGYVYIYTGIIKSMRDESELAGVLGHEIAHVAHHHYRNALAKQTGLSVLLQVLLGPDAGQLQQTVAQVFFTLSSLHLSRDNEADADRYGTRYTAVSGRNPLGIAKYFGRVKNQGPEWLSSHPAPANRVEKIQAQVAGNPAYSSLAANAPVTEYKPRFDQMTAPIR
jgi:predicted Zn-dependent protease